MKRSRIAIVTRRFWPLFGGPETLLANLGIAWRNLGRDVRVVTAQWESSWNKEFDYRELPITRLPKPAQIGWGVLRYMLSLGRWLREHQRDLDLVYVDGLRQDAYAALGALATSRVPVVLRAHRAGPRGEVAWQARASFGSRIRRRCQQAATIVVPSPLVVNELTQSGYFADRLHVIANGTPEVAPNDIELQLAAREVLAAANSDLSLEPYAPLAVYVGRLDAADGLNDLIHAWRPIVEQWPEARLWLIGDGPGRDELFETITDCDLRFRVFMPGRMDEPLEALRAADLFVMPSRMTTQSLALLEAMMAGVPIVAADTPANRELITPDIHGWLVPSRGEREWASAMHEALTNRAYAAQRRDAARQRAETDFSLERCAVDHLRLFDGL